MTATTSDPNDQRRASHAYLSDDAHDTWHRVSADLGCSVSAMLEAMAVGFEAAPGVTAMDERLAPIVKRARRIDADRRRR